MKIQFGSVSSAGKTRCSTHIGSVSSLQFPLIRFAGLTGMKFAGSVRGVLILGSLISLLGFVGKLLVADLLHGGWFNDAHFLIVL